MDRGKRKSCLEPCGLVAIACENFSKSADANFTTELLEQTYGVDPAGRTQAARTPQCGP